MSEPLWQPKSNAQARGLGAGALLVGVAVLWWQVLGTWRQASAGKPELRYSIELILLGAMAAVFGAWWIVHGLAGYRAVREMQSRPAARRWLLVTGFVVALGAYLGFRWWLARLGYAETS